MEIIFREHILSHLVKPCIETYLNGKHEFVGQLYGSKDKNKFILEDIFIDFTAITTKENEVFLLPERIYKKIFYNLEGLTIGHHIGDVHPHIILPEEVDSFENKKKFLSEIKDRSEIEGEDSKSMEKDNSHIYLIIAVSKKRYQIKWGRATDDKSLIGSTNDLTFYISAWYYNTRRKMFETAKINSRMP